MDRRAHRERRNKDSINFDHEFANDADAPAGTSQLKGVRLGLTQVSTGPINIKTEQPSPPASVTFSAQGLKARRRKIGADDQAGGEHDRKSYNDPSTSWVTFLMNSNGSAWQ